MPKTAFQNAAATREAKNAKKILVITQVFPSGLSGTTVKTRQTLEYLLKQGHKLDVLCIHHPTMKKNGFTHKNLNLFVFEKEVMSKFTLGYFLRAYKLLFSFLPFRIKKMHDDRLEKKLRELEQNNSYDAILYDGFSTLQYARDFQSNHIYIDDEDITDLLWKRRRQTNNPVLKLFFLIEAWKCQSYEKVFLLKMAQVWAISPNTKSRLEKITPAQTTLMPTVVQEHANIFSPNGKDVVFTALLSWMENVVGLKWFLEHCWADILKEVPKTKLLITGQMADDTLRKYVKQFPNVVMKGFVPDLRTIYQQAAVAIAPILINSGIKVKVLTYLSFGIPVVALTQATWGMTSLDGVQTASTEDFALQVVKLLKQKTTREKMSNQATRNIHLYHSEDALAAFFKKVEFLHPTSKET